VEEEQPLLTHKQPPARLFSPSYKNLGQIAAAREVSREQKCARKTTAAFLPLRAEPLPVAEDMFEENTL